MTFKEVIPQYDDYPRFKFTNAGDQIQGELIEKTRIDNNGSSFMKYVVKPENEDALSFLGFYQLDISMKEVPLGANVRVTYNGKRKLKNNRMMNTCTVEVADSDSAA